jgi:hypothetical protein
MARKRVYLSIGQGAAVACRPEGTQEAWEALPGRSDRSASSPLSLLPRFRIDDVIADLGGGRYWLLPREAPKPRA